MGVVAFFIGGGLPIELLFYPGRLVPYLTVYAVELVLCGAAWVAARYRPAHARTIATAWAAGLGMCVASYYPLVQADATLAMAALISLVAVIPAVLPLGLRHQMMFGGACALSFFAILACGVPMSLPWQYTFFAFIAVFTTSSIAARELARFRADAFERQAVLRDAHGQLGTALARAEHAVTMRSRLVANVSHELRTPLNVIVGYADMLVDGVDDPEAIADTAPRIRRYAVSLEALVSDLLDYSRLGCAKVDLDLEDIDVKPLLDDVARGAVTNLRGRPVTVSVECSATRFTSDRMRLAQVLNNLATNAAKFTPEGSIVISAHEEPNAMVFAVRDTGCGIAPAQHEAIFAAFEQVAPHADHNAGGIGLGLALVRQLTDILGGTVTVASALGHGATFTVRLPAAAAARAA